MTKARPLLDPATAAASVNGDWRPSDRLPLNVRRFGYIPDVTRLQPGDLLLFQALDGGDKFTAKIREAQDGYGESQAFTHAAVYVHQTYIVESDYVSPVKNGVLYAPFWGYVGGYRIRVRRPKQNGRTAAEYREMQWRLAVNALAQLPNRYNLLTAVWTGFKRYVPFLRPGPAQAGRICSQVYAQAFAIATEENLVPVDTKQAYEDMVSRFPLPAQLDGTPNLDDQDIGWLKVIG